MAEQLNAAVVSERLLRIQRRTPELARRCRTNILLDFDRRGKPNIAGGVMADTGPNRDLAKYYGAALQTTRRDDGMTLTAGLPAADEQARILALRETGGTIRPKNDRPNPHLRIPLGPAKTPTGYDRYAGVKLRALPGNPFKLLPRPGKNTLLVLAAPRGKGKAKYDKAGTPWYVLVKSVRIGPHPWFRATTAQVAADTNGIIDATVKSWGGEQ